MSKILKSFIKIKPSSAGSYELQRFYELRDFLGTMEKLCNIQTIYLSFYYFKEITFENEMEIIWF